PFNPAPALTYANAIATDADGNAYVGGTYIWKVNPRGSGLVFSAKPGGGSVNAIAIDQDRNVYVGGGAYTYPTFVTKFSADASQILYSAYLGGYYGEPVRSIAVDARGIAYAAGNTTSPTFPTRAPVEGSLLAFPSGFASALTTDGADILFSTYLSDGRELEAVALALDPSGNPVVAGHNVGPPPYGYSRVPGADSDILIFAFDYSQARNLSPRLDAVLNTASRLSLPIAPRQRVSLRGKGFTTGARVWFDYQSVEALAVRDGEIVAEPPAFLHRVARRHGSPGLLRVRVSVELPDGTRSNEVLMPVGSAEMALYSADGSGTGNVLALNA